MKCTRKLIISLTYSDVAIIEANGNHVWVVRVDIEAHHLKGTTDMLEHISRMICVLTPEFVLQMYSG